jgi:hypothetical protein
MGVTLNNVVRFDPRGQRQPRVMPAPLQRGRPQQRDDLQSLETLSSQLATLKATLALAIVNYSQACVAAGQADPQAQLRTLLQPVETLEAGMHRLAGAMAAQLPR